MARRRVLITGVGSFIGATLARRLEDDPDFEYVAGLDTRRPVLPLDRTEFIHADIRDPDWEWRVMIQLYASLENDEHMEWAAELGTTIANGCIAAGEWEHAADLLFYMEERAPESPAVQALALRIRTRLAG